MRKLQGTKFRYTEFYGVAHTIYGSARINRTKYEAMVENELKTLMIER
jgi:hypothetical protein